MREAVGKDRYAKIVDLYRGLIGGLRKLCPWPNF
jgi:hypothetical protein